MTEYDVGIIGGGASGMMAGIMAARSGAKTAIFDKKKQTGTKLLRTGNGRCNFSHASVSPNDYHHAHSDFLARCFETFSVEDTISFFEELGIYSAERRGFLFPQSESAQALRDALMYELERLKVDIYTGTDAVSVRHQNGHAFIIRTEMTAYTASDDAKKVRKVSEKAQKYESYTERSFTVRKVILSAGSCASPKTGSDGSGYVIASSLGHTIIDPEPALVPLESADSFFAHTGGVRGPGHIKLFVNKRFVDEDEGEIQFISRGLSGIPVFQISSAAVRALRTGAEVEVSLDMVPDWTAEKLHQFWNAQRMNLDKPLDAFFAGIVPRKIIAACAFRLGFDTKTARLDNTKRDQFIKALKKTVFKITGAGSFDEAQVCSGGVSVSEIEPGTMASKVCPGLYLCGEIVDIDGKCGGFNLQWAWTSGAAAGRACGLHH